MTDRRAQNITYTGEDKRSIDRITFWQGNQIKFWRSTVMTLLFVIGGICTWAVVQITDIPKVYATRSSVIALGAKMDTLQAGINEINRYLRE